MKLVHGKTLLDTAIRGAAESHVMVAPDALGIPLQAGIQPVGKLVLIQDVNGADKAQFIALFPGKERRENVLLGEYGTAAKLGIVVAEFQGEFTGPLALKLDFRAEFPLGPEILETKGQVTAQTNLLGELLECSAAQLNTEAFHVVVGKGLRPEAEFHPPGFHFIIVGTHGAGNTVHPFVEAAALDIVHHFVDALFPFREYVRPYALPINFVPGDDIAHHDRFRRSEGVRVRDWLEDGWLVNHVPVSQERQNLGGVAH